MELNIGTKYKFDGEIDSFTICELKPGERLKKKNGKKLVKGKGSKRIKLTGSGWNDNGDFNNDKNWLLDTPYTEPLELKEPLKDGEVALGINGIVVRQHYIYRCKLNLRPTKEGQPLKQGLINLNGQEFDFYCGWMCEDDSQYAGEFAMTPYPSNNILRDYDVAWIASGDLEFIVMVEDDTNKSTPIISNVMQIPKA